MDCLDFLRCIQDNSVDLAIIDPPYNMNKASWDTFKSKKDFFEFTYSWIDKLIPKLKKSGSLYIFNTPYNSAFILNYLVKKELYFQNWITWDKRDGLSGAKTRFNNGQETILFFSNGKNHTFNYDEVRMPYKSTERMEHAKKKGILKMESDGFLIPKGNSVEKYGMWRAKGIKIKSTGKSKKWTISLLNLLKLLNELSKQVQTKMM